MKILFAITLMMSSLAFAAEEDLSGSYYGCGVHSVFGKKQLNFHLVKMRTGFTEKDVFYAAGFVWQGVSETYFPEVKFSGDKTEMLMNVSMLPKRDYGMIVKTLHVKFLPDGRIEGEYRSNSTGDGNKVSYGKWTARKLASGEAIPTKCN